MSGIINLVTAHVTIGKEKEITTYIFHERDFLRIEEKKNDCILVIRNDDRKLKIDEECKRQVIFQMNYL